MTNHYRNGRDGRTLNERKFMKMPSDEIVHLGIVIVIYFALQLTYLHFDKSEREARRIERVERVTKDGDK